MIKTFEEFVNEGLLDIFSGDGCKNLETVCSAFAKRLSKISPIKYNTKSLDGEKVVEQKLYYSDLLTLEYISADDDLVVDRSGQRTIREEAERIVKSYREKGWETTLWKDEESCYKYITKFLYKTDDLKKGNDVFADNRDKATAIFSFSIPYLEPVEGEKDLYKLEWYLYRTYASFKTNGKDDKETAIKLLNKAFYSLYKGLTDPEDKLIEYTDSKDTTFKDIRKYIPQELINLAKKESHREDLK